MPLQNKSYTCSRKAQLFCRASAPASLDEAKRSVEFVASTEQPVEVWDWELCDLVPEVLRMDGVILPTSERVPLLDTHNNMSQCNVLGSFGSLRVENGTVPQLVGRAEFSSVPAAQEAFTRVKEGHLTDVSVGYSVLESVWIPEGTTANVSGTSYTGPVRIATKWELFEVSLCPVGADHAAKARAKIQEGTMPKKTMRQGQRAEGEANICTYLIEGLCTLEGGPLCTYLSEKGCTKSATETNTNESENIQPESPESLNMTADMSEEPEGSRADPEEDEQPCRSRAALGERRRITGIRALCRAHAIAQDLEDKLITQGKSLDFARAAVLERISARNAGAAFARVSMGSSEGEKVRSAAAQGLLLRCGLPAERIARNARLAAGAEEFRGMTMLEIARDLLGRAGQNRSGDRMSLMGRALTSTDLPLLLTDTANRMLLEGFEQGDMTWQDWCGTGDVNDFRPNKSVGFNFMKDLKKVPEAGEYAYSYGAEHAETYQVETYGAIFPVTRQALINDDLGAFTQLATAHGEAAQATINRLAIAVLTANATMADGTKLFASKHRNLITSAGGAPTVEKIAAVETTMLTQRDFANNSVKIVPRFFIAPVALKAAAEVFFTSQLIGTQQNPNQTNIYGGERFVRVYDPLLDESSGKDWYLAGDKGKGVNVYFLSGGRAPRLEEKQGWSVDGMEYKVSIDIGAKAVTWQALAKSTSATS